MEAFSYYDCGKKGSKGYVQRLRERRGETARIQLVAEVETHPAQLHEVWKGCPIHPRLRFSYS